MKPNIMLAVCLSVAAASPAASGTFAKVPIAPELGLEALTRGVSRARVGRDLFANPYATVTLANVDLYDRFPYVESRTFQIVSDPRWSRLIYGEAGRSLKAFDGAGTPLGRLSGPRGLAVDERNQVYVADAGNNRVLVLQAATEFGEVTLTPRFAITGLGDPFDVAYSDGGTPFVAGDDHLYVVESGKNRVAAFALEANGARFESAIGDLGSGTGHFAGPMAVAVGRVGGVNSRDVYVGDAHNQRIVHLRHEARGLVWAGSAPSEASLVTSLETDEWGNLYAAAPQQGVVRKFSPALAPVATLKTGLERPKSFHIAFANVHDHRSGLDTRRGTPNAVALDQWTDQSGVSLWSLGLQVEGLGVSGGERPAARFNLTDRAVVTLELRDGATGRLLSRRVTAPLEAGAQELALTDAERNAASASASDDLMLRLGAASTYPDGPTATAAASFRLTGGSAVMVSARPVLVGNWPNPVRGATRIGFVLPAGGAKAALGIFDAQGRRIRRFDARFVSGWNEVSWDGTDDHGLAVNAGAYFYRLDVGPERFTRSLVLVR